MIHITSWDASIIPRIIFSMAITFMQHSAIMLNLFYFLLPANFSTNGFQTRENYSSELTEEEKHGISNPVFSFPFSS